MSFSEMSGFETETHLGNEFYKYYYGINKHQWKRIENSAKLLSKEGIGPKVNSSFRDDDTGTIIFQKVQPFREIYNDLKINKKQIKTKITDLVKHLHSLGYAHGDLNLDNIGYKKGEFFILDPDTIYRITKTPPQWLKKWMDEGFEWEGTFNEFIKYDYTNWVYELDDID